MDRLSDAARQARAVPRGIVPPLFLLSLLLLLGSSCPAAILRVKQGAPGPVHDGSTWSQALLTVGDAITQSAPHDEIWVAKGTYNERLRIEKDLSLYGGFAGTETSRVERNIITNVTILDGGNHDVITLPTPINAAYEVTVDGFSIRNPDPNSGRPTGIVVTGTKTLQPTLDLLYCTLTGHAVALSATYAVLNVRENAFTANGASTTPITPCIDLTNIQATPPSTVSNNTVSANMGDGIKATTSALVIATNIVSGNGTSSGQGIDVTGSPSITDNIVVENKNGGIVAGSGNPRIERNKVERNGSYGISVSAAAFTVAQNTVSDNTGAGITMALTSSAKGDIRANTVSGNTATGIKVSSGETTIRRNIIRNNSTTQNGGGLYVYGGAPLIDSNVVAGNSAAGTGGGIYVTGVDAVLVNNTVSGNSSPALGGGIHATGGNAVIANTIVAYNSSGIEALETATLRGNDVYANVAYDYGGIEDPTGSDGNLSVEPDFAGPPARDLHLQPGSPLINAGNSGDVPAYTPPTDVAQDVDGQARIQGATVDIGADESDGTVWPPNRIVRVAPTGVDSDINDGSSWALAKRTVQAAIDAVAGGGEVWVKEGIYDEKIILRTGVAVYGGFAGTETERGQRDANAHATLLNGGDKGTVVTVPVGTGASETLDGFGVQHSKKADYGIIADQATLVLAHNTLSMSNNAIDVGACLLFATDNTITGNAIGINATTSTGEVAANDIYDNTGAGINYTVATSGHATLRQNTITHNGGGGLKISGPSATITRNVIRGNSGTDGAGLYLGTGTQYVDNNVILSNSASGKGGGICTSGSTSTIINNTISGNSAPCLSGGIFTTKGSVTLVNNIIAFNSSGVANDLSNYPNNLCTQTFRNNDVFGNAGYDYLLDGTEPTGNNGNISVNPLLAGAPARNTHIQPDSPCVNAGSDADVVDGALDIDGQARIQGAHADIGADESDGTRWPGNLVIRVAPSGRNDNDGLSWEKPKQTIQAGVDAVMGGGEVWVKKGLYAERIVLAPGVALYGGFTGTETRRDQRNWTDNVTTIDGGSTGDVISLPAGTGAIEVIDGFTIQHQSRTGNGISADRAALSIAHNTLTLNGNGASLAGCWADIRENTVPNNGTGIGTTNCCVTIEQNAVNGNNADGISASGGGATIRQNTVQSNGAQGIQTSSNSALIAANTVTGNAVGGVLVTGTPEILGNAVNGNGSYGISSTSGVPTIRDNTVRMNSGYGIQCKLGKTDSPVIDNNEVAENTNSGLWITDGVPRISNNRVTDNRGSEGSGIHVMNGSPTIEQNIVTGNGTAQGGGGIYTADAAATMVLNTVSANDGYGVSCVNALVAINANLVTQNKGPGVTLSLLASAKPNIGNNTLQDNQGSGLKVTGGTPNINNNLIVRNVSPDTGGGIALNNASADIINNTIADNTAALRGGALSVSGGTSRLGNTLIAFNSSGVDVSAGSLAVSYTDAYHNGASDYQGIPNPTGADGNISKDPLFVDRATANYHLGTGSPAINAGNNALVLPGWLDIDGTPRIQQDVVDIGADESTGAATGYTLADVAQALKIVGGLTAGDGAEQARLNVVDSGSSAGKVDAADAVALARKVSGLD